MEATSNRTKLILWAFDPFEPHPPVNSKTLGETSERLRRFNAVIEPVYVAYKASQGEIDLENTLMGELKKYPLALRPARMIPCEGSTAAKAVGALVEYAESCGTALIVVTSHGRQGLARMTFGSFAEALLASSKVPLYFLNRHRTPDSVKIGTALFATDFSKHCQRAFAHFLKLASGMIDELIVYHDMNFIYEMTAYGSMYGMDFPVSQTFVDEQIRWVQEEARRWVAKARRRGFRAAAVIQERHDISESILNEAKSRGAGLIVLASQAGPVSSLILGSHARAVFRAGEIPVLAYGPRNGRRIEMIRREVVNAEALRCKQVLNPRCEN